MSRNQSAWQATVNEFAADYRSRLAPETRRMLAQCRFDLWFGPCAEEDFPGFEAACRRIRRELADLPSDLYVDPDSGEWSEREPAGETCEACDGYGETDDGHVCPECHGCGGREVSGEWVRVSRTDIKRAVVGGELAEYV